MFDDLLAANRRYAETAPRGLEGVARAGVAIVTCMDSRLDPLPMLGLELGDAKVIRTPGAHVTRDALNGCILAVNLLKANRVLVIAHTKCAMASCDDDEMRERVAVASGRNADNLSVGADPNQIDHLRDDVARLRNHRLIADRAEVAGFLYDVDTALLRPVG